MEGSVTRLTITEWPETAVATFFVLTLLGVKNIADRAGDERRVHNRAVYNRVLGQRFQPKTDELVAVFRAL